jgi:septal ring-binding cell division protein DamX
VNILADKALLAAYSENQYQVTAKHVQAAIADSEFGLERSRQQAKKSQALLWVALLALGLALGFAFSKWSQNPLQKPMQKEMNIGANKHTIKTDALEANAEEASNPAKNARSNDVETNNTQMTTLAPSADILTNRINATNVWLSNQPPTTVSIQLMGASSDAQLKTDLEILSQQMELDNIYVYRTKVNNQPFLSVLYGSFANRFEATEALKKLPLELQKNHPQLRTIAGVLQETK